MKCFLWTPFMIGAVALVVSSCQNSGSPDSVVSQQFIHKYGFNLSEEEWEQRAQAGQVVTLLKNGVKVTRSYENGLLNGPTTYTFPHLETIEKCLEYDQGTLLKETLYDVAGIPVREEAYEFDDRIMVTLWSGKGVPISIEKYDGDLLMEGKYYSLEHELEARIENGFGERIKWERSGAMISRDRIEGGIMTERRTYHPNGEVHTISHYHDYQLHGEQLKYTILGRPLMKLQWDHGILDGEKVVYRNGLKVAEIPYIQGQKHGSELHYDDLGNLIAEISWRNDAKHGCSMRYTEETSEADWFFNGQSVTADRFEQLVERERLVAEFDGLDIQDEEF